MLPETLLLPAETHAVDGGIHDLPRVVAPFGRRGVIVHGSALASGERLEALLQACREEGLSPPVTVRHKGGEPTLDDVERLRSDLRRERPQWVAAIGGGSVMDLAKAATGLLNAPLAISAYFEGASIPAATVPLIAAPTTAGTGSEATIVAVLTDPASRRKRSIRHPSFMPRQVILDPQLMEGCPRSVLAAAGMDALTQAYESYVSRGATDFTRALSETALVAIVRSLPLLYHGTQAAAASMLQGSFVAGLALSHARLGLVHGLAHPLGARWNVPHGQVCAICLPHVLRYNAGTAAKAHEVLKARLGRPLEEIVLDFNRNFRLRNPFSGTLLKEVETIVDETLRSGSTAANPRLVKDSDVMTILLRLFEA